MKLTMLEIKTMFLICLLAGSIMIETKIKTSKFKLGTSRLKTGRKTEKKLTQRPKRVKSH